MRVIIVDIGPGAIAHAVIERLATLANGHHVIMVSPDRPEPETTIGLAQVLDGLPRLTNVTNVLDNAMQELRMSLNLANLFDAPGEIPADPLAVRRGIVDCFHQLNRLTRLVLARLGPRPRRFRFIFQPCWSTHRWKSLT